jgi:hypothetical protein
MRLRTHLAQIRGTLAADTPPSQRIQWALELVDELLAQTSRDHLRFAICTPAISNDGYPFTQIVIGDAADVLAISPGLLKWTQQAEPGDWGASISAAFICLPPHLKELS